MTDWFPYLFFLVCLVVTRRVYLTWAWGESCHKTLVLLVFLICLCPNIYPVVLSAELQKRADRAEQSVLFFLAGANFWEKHAKNRRKHAKIGENTQKQAKNRRFFGANFCGGKLVGANFYAFCNYDYWKS